ncbi:MAG: PilX N-terminal domain-containing pilus assembly protein [Rubrivivax sp.]|nr:PilX N-terminal domain-containing pilus assembly protein [Rubrivivax sp.]
MNAPHPSLHGPRCRGGARRQRGLATLVVVSMLFFIVSLVAAYANRNLIFEQRTSANQARSTLAFETADAGVEWAASMLNLGRIDDTCEPVDDAAATSFRERYLEIDATTGLVQPRANMAAGSVSLPTCVHNGTQWLCSCPATGAPTIAGAPAGGVAPAFRLRFVQRPVNRPGTVWVEVQACTRLDDACLGTGAVNATAGEGRAKTAVLLALRSALPSPPVAALVARGTVDLSDSVVRVSNPQQGSGRNLAIHAGGALSGDGALVLGGAAGEIASASTQILAPDAALSTAIMPAGDWFFGSLFGIQATVYRDQPASLPLPCNVASPCNAARLRAVAARNPGRILWAQGDVDLDGGAALGSAAEPVMLVVEGNLAANDIQVHGLIYGRKDSWSFTANNLKVFGAVVAENDLTLSGPVDVTRNANVLNLLRWRHGSFVRVPGGWSDY